MKKLFFAIVLILTAICVGGGIYSPEPAPITVEHTVQTGQTLWDIAGELKCQYGDRRDVREIIFEITQSNGGNGYIYPGQRLTITIKPEARQ